MPGLQTQLWQPESCTAATARAPRTQSSTACDLGLAVRGRVLRWGWTAPRLTTMHWPPALELCALDKRSHTVMADNSVQLSMPLWTTCSWYSTPIRTDSTKASDQHSNPATKEYEYVSAGNYNIYACNNDLLHYNLIF